MCWLMMATGAGSTWGQSRPVAENEGAPTYTGDIAPIIKKHCLECHQSGGVGAAPFELTDYNDVRKRATLIATLTGDRQMPPWLAAPQPEALRFVDERGLTGDEILLIQQWVDAGCVKGDAGAGALGNPAGVDPEAAPPHDADDRWSLGIPDRILTLPNAYESPAEGTDVLVSFVLPTGLERDGMLRAIEFKPGNPRAIHHASFLADSTGVARDLANASASGSFLGMGSLGLNPAGSLGVWSPGCSPHELPEGVGRPVRAGSDIVVEVHFSPTGKPEPFTFSIGLYLNDEAEREEANGGAHDANVNVDDADPAKPHPISPALTVTLGSFLIDIPPGKANEVVEDVFVLPVDARVLSLTPHAHKVCKSIEVTATRPGDADRMVLLSIPRWNFDWMTEFAYREPVMLPAGTEVRVRFAYDNTAGNPRNPNDPPQEVKAGHRLSDEMALLLVNVTPVHEGEGQFLEEAHRQSIGRRIAARDAARGGEQRPRPIQAPG